MKDIGGDILVLSGIFRTISFYGSCVTTVASSKNWCYGSKEQIGDDKKSFSGVAVPFVVDH
jgi:hypothetical protein